MPIGIGTGFLFAGGSLRAPGVLPHPYVQTMLFVNDTPLQVAGVTLQRPEKWLDGVTRALPETDRVRGFTGGSYELLPTIGPRDVVLTGVMLDVPLLTQQAALRDLSDLLQGELELRWPHAPTQVMRGVAGPPLVSPLNPDKAFVLDAEGRVPLVVTVTIRCADAAVYEQHPRRLRLGTTPKPLVMGGLAIGGEILLEGPLSGDVDIDILSASGGLLGRTALRGVLLESIDDRADSLTIRMDAPHTMIKRRGVDGVETSVYHWRSLSLSTRWANPSPRYADPARQQWPYVRLSTGAGWWTYLIANSH